MTTLAEANERLSKAEKNAAKQQKALDAARKKAEAAAEPKPEGAAKKKKGLVEIVHIVRRIDAAQTLSAEAGQFDKIGFTEKQFSTIWSHIAAIQTVLDKAQVASDKRDYRAAALLEKKEARAAKLAEEIARLKGETKQEVAE